MFGHMSLPSRIYSFGALAPTHNLDLVEDQIYRAHRYRNDLVAIECERRTACQQLLLAHYPGLSQAEALVTELDNQVKQMLAQIAANNAAARRKRATPAEQATLKEQRQALKEARATAKTLRKAAYADPRMRQALDQVDAEAKAKSLALRAGSQLYWPVYLAVEQSLMDMRRGAPPQFKRWRGDGKFSVQLQGGLSLDELFSEKDTQLRLAPVPAEAYAPRKPARERYTLCHLRVGSDAKRKPIWAVVPVFLHRPLPAGSRVKWAYLLRRRIGTQVRWQFQLVLERACGWAKSDLATDGTVGIDLGWRILPRNHPTHPGGLRVAYWVGSDNDQGELILPRDDLSRWTKVESLQSIRDRNFDDIRHLLGEYLDVAEVPTWFQEETSSLAQWRSPARLCTLWRRWSLERFPGDRGIWTLVACWCKQDQHLWDWQAFQLRRSLNWRDNLFRHFVRDMRRRYHLARLEDADWSQLQRRPGPEEASDLQARMYQRIASVGRLRQLLEEGMARTERLPTPFTTLTCHHCGQTCAFDAARNLQHTCEHCGTTWDQDENAGHNLLNGNIAAAPA
jgi:hypothetical protein